MELIVGYFAQENIDETRIRTKNKPHHWLKTTISNFEILRILVENYVVILRVGC
jgi:hypothetical protein